MTEDSNPPLTLFEKFAARTLSYVDELSARISFVMATRPTATRCSIAAFMVIGLMFAFQHRAHAAPSMMQDEIQTAYNISFNFGIFDNSIALAQYIFATLAGITIIVQIVSHYIRNQTIQGLGKTILSSVLSLGIPFVIIQIAPIVLPVISLVGLQIADIITGNTTSNVGNSGTTPDPGALHGALNVVYNSTFGAATGSVDVTPTAIVDQGIKMAWPLLMHVQQATTAGQGSAAGSTGIGLNDTVFSANQMITGFVLALSIGIIGAFVFIAVELVLAYLQIYLVLPVAAFSLGFLGSPATRQFGQGYWVIVVQALLRFATIVFVIGFAMSLATLWDLDVANYTIGTVRAGVANGDVGIMKQAISAAAVTFSLLYIVRTLPTMFGAILTNSFAGADGNQAESQLGMAGQRFGGRGSILPGGIRAGGRTVSTPGQTPLNRP